MELQDKIVKKRRRNQIIGAIVRNYFTTHKPDSNRNSAIHSTIFNGNSMNPFLATFLTKIPPSDNQQIENKTKWDFELFIKSDGKNSEEWKQTFGLSKCSYERLCSSMREILQKTDTRFGTTIPLEKRIAIGLRKLASGDSYTVTGSFFGMPKSSVHRTTRELVTALVSNKDQWIKSSLSSTSNANFSSQMPNVVALIVPFTVELAWNMNQQQRVIACHLVIDQRQRILEVISDGIAIDYKNQNEGLRELFEKSNFFQKANNNEILMKPLVSVNGTILRPIIVAPRGNYPFLNWLVTPFDNFPSTVFDEFNKIADETIAKLQSRWKILNRKLENTHEYVAQTLIACACLHNFLIENDDFDHIYEHGEEILEWPIPQGAASPCENMEEIQKALKSLINI